jgi:hypothetical protein
MEIVIGFSKPKSPFSFFGHLIRLYSGEDYSHCYIKFRASKLISQASKGMVNFTHESVFLEHNTIVKEFSVPVTVEQFKQIADYSILTAGRPYSILQVIGILVADILNLNRNPLDMDKSTFICSEYLGQILIILGLRITKHLSLLTPEDIYIEMRRVYGQKI